MSGHQGILNLHFVNLPRGYQRQSVPEEVSSCCADEAKIHMEFNNLNADIVLKAAVKKYVFTVRKMCWWLVLNKALFP